MSYGSINAGPTLYLLICCDRFQKSVRKAFCFTTFFEIDRSYQIVCNKSCSCFFFCFFIIISEVNRFNSKDVCSGFAVTCAAHRLLYVVASGCRITQRNCHPMVAAGQKANVEERMIPTNF